MNLKNLTVLDIGLIKWSVLFCTLFLVSVWPAFANWIIGTHWAWFLVIGLLLAIKPTLKVFRK